MVRPVDNDPPTSRPDAPAGTGRAIVGPAGNLVRCLAQALEAPNWSARAAAIADAKVQAEVLDRIILEMPHRQHEREDNARRRL